MEATLTPDAEAVAAAERILLLDRLGLRLTGANTQADIAIVEAAEGASGLAVVRQARQAANAKRRSMGDQREAPRDGNFEAKHRRGAGGKWIAMGASGREVRAIQRRTGAKVDGDFGDKTKAAVEAYQKAHGLTVDGIVGRQTVAALRGRTDASKVKVGGITSSDREFLKGHVKSEGRKRGSRNRAKIVEAVALPELLDRVQQLEPGELAMLPDGGAVKHAHTQDAREVWIAGSPASWRDDGISWGEMHRTPELAVAAALTDSAGRSDPESLGGPTRWSRYSPITVNGSPGEFRGVDANGQPLVRLDGGARDPSPSSWPALTRTTRLLESEHWRKQPRKRDGEWVEDGHPDAGPAIGRLGAKTRTGSPKPSAGASSLSQSQQDRQRDRDAANARITTANLNANRAAQGKAPVSPADVGRNASRSPVTGQVPGEKLPAAPTKAGNDAKRAEISKRELTSSDGKTWKDPKAKAAYDLALKLKALDPNAGPGFQSRTRAADAHGAALALNQYGADSPEGRRALRNLDGMRRALEIQGKTDLVKQLDAVTGMGNVARIGDKPKRK